MSLKSILAKSLASLASSCELYDIHAACVLRLLASSLTLGTTKYMAAACIEQAARHMDQLRRDIDGTLADFVADREKSRCDPSSN